MMDLIYGMIFLIPLNALVFWKGEEGKFLWVIPAFADTIIGLLFMVGVTQWTVIWIIGFAIIILGLYCFYQFIEWGVGMNKKRTRKG